MSTIKDQIEKAVGKSASELTEMVTEIGEGSFPKGLERIRKDGVDEGIRTTINVAKEMIKKLSCNRHHQRNRYRRCHRYRRMHYLQGRKMGDR